MPFYLEITPGIGDEARVETHPSDGPRLIMDLDGAHLTVQVNTADPGGAELAAMFARAVATAASRFARACEALADQAVAG